MRTYKSWPSFLLVLVGACGGQAYTLKYAPSFSRSGRHISVFGIRRDGLMSPGGWSALGPEQTAPFDGNSCDVAYAESSLSQRPALESALRDYVQANGVTDELLTQLAPAAKGDTIMLLTIAGHPLPRGAQADSAGWAATPPTGTAQGGRRGRGRGGARASSSSGDASSSAEPFDVSATFFSVAEHRSVGLVELAYSGSRVDEALDQFRSKLETEFPGASCSGWDWSVPIDDASIRKLNEQ
jgi:hypothetical protein